MNNDASTPAPTTNTLGALRERGWKSRSVQREMHANAVARIQRGEPIVESVLGYEETVMPQLENALLAGHDVIFLGERGQAKTRMIRALVELLDEWMPVVSGSEIHDDPFHPVSLYARNKIAEDGDDTHISWVHRSRRYGEKLATPDTSIADLIGEVDPIKVAEGRYLSDELTLHYGLVPRTNRGIFAINELPDLAERIQVGLLNVLEERDIQVRGYKVQLPIDVMLVASANPEDYTNRGRLITPLKDRFGSQIRTHYPQDVDIEIQIIKNEATIVPSPLYDVTIPEFMYEIIATFSQLARESTHISQRSGVSVRMSVTNLEALVANAMRRTLKAGETNVVPRVGDLGALFASTSGKIELDTLEDDRESDVVDHLIRSAVLTVFRNRVPQEPLVDIVDHVSVETPIQFDEDADVATNAASVDALAGLRELSAGIVRDSSSDAQIVSAAEFILEGLHLAKRLNKDSFGPKSHYRQRS